MPHNQNKRGWIKERFGMKPEWICSKAEPPEGSCYSIGNVFSSLIHSVARNPSLAKQSFGYAILGFALTEAIASFASMMAFLISSIFRSKVELS
ncbi:hypothetical protein CIPAW_06G021700 [Carya illinoinensis]|uniref:ATP synthase subunit 9, mitochondrial n=1 Tax=Carya illinoinensis TaxID=32201 RepID=A0A8T1Q552_CARIL|nr:hypothetical protein CIPAW_06G021700 [Carya illinoinensis]